MYVYVMCMLFVVYCGRERRLGGFNQKDRTGPRVNFLLEMSVEKGIGVIQVSG